MSASRFVYLLATLDTKGAEAAFVTRCLSNCGAAVRLVDVGCLGESNLAPDVTSEEVFQAAGATKSVMASTGNRGAAVEMAASGATAIVLQAQARGELAGVMAIGGSAGTTIGTSAMRTLPLGVPKVMVSTLASGQVRPYVGDKDIAMFNSVVDIAGINRISRLVMSNAAAAMAGMVAHPMQAEPNDKPLIAATMFGVTTPCVQRAKEVLEAAGYEVLVFHATGSGGQAMESLIRDGLIAGVLDITTTELADELVDGTLSAGPTRLTAAGEMGIPQVVSVGALDMVNFGPRDTVPAKFADRRFHVHNANVTLMRTTVEENAAIGAEIGRKLSLARGPMAVLLPSEGVSAIDRAGQNFDDPLARATLFAAIRQHCHGVEVEELPCHINDPDFAETAAQRLLYLLKESKPRMNADARR